MSVCVTNIHITIIITIYNNKCWSTDVTSRELPLGVRALFQSPSFNGCCERYLGEQKFETQTALKA